MYVWKCDLCGFVQKDAKDKAVFHHISALSSDRTYEKDVCPDCMRKMLKAIDCKN